MNRRGSVASIVCLGLWLCWVLSACVPSFQEVTVTGTSVTVFGPGTQDVDVDVVFEAASQEIGETLPGAYFQGMVFSGRCQDLPHLQGKLVLIFRQVKPAIPRRRVVRAAATVDTVRQTMDLHYVDESRFYPSTQGQTFGGDHSIREIASIAHKHITELGICDGDVTLTQLDDSWVVRCGPLHNFTQRCSFEIVNGEIKDK